MLGITIRMNANTNTMTVGGQTFDRSKMTKDQLKQARRQISRAFR